jgi:DNA-binding response OmpR family regulator
MASNLPLNPGALPLTTPKDHSPSRASARRQDEHAPNLISGAFSTNAPIFRRIHALIIASTDALIEAVHTCCPPPDVLETVSHADTVARITEEASRSDAVLVEWRREYVGLFPVLDSALEALEIPLIALCTPSPAEHIAALLIGADYVETFPTYPVLFRARLESYRRRLEDVPLTPARSHEHVTLNDASKAIETDSNVSSAEGHAIEKEKRQTAIPEHHQVQVNGPLRLDMTARRLYVAGDLVELTDMEFKLMAFMMNHGRACCTRDEILEKVWGISYDTSTNIVDVHIHGLRRKLRRCGLGKAIETVRGHGYRLVVPEL